MKLETVNDLKQYYQSVQDNVIKDYMTFLEFQSISSEKSHQKDLLNCFEWLSSYLKNNGFKTEKWKTSGHPTLFAETTPEKKDAKTLLIYGHYDVQPVDPLELWDSPPFNPTIKDGKMFARGAQDNKGQIFYCIQACIAYLKMQNQHNHNIKFVIEGEEETGSKGLSEILEEKKDQLKADYLIVADVGIPAKDIPALTMGIRGIISMDVTAVGSNTDLHSGTHGGLAYNPNHALVNILSKIRSDEGKILIPGFYDKVKDLPDQDKEMINMEFDTEKYRSRTGASPTGGEVEFSPIERATIRPTLEINGISGGYTGSGFKTVIPKVANAKISCRLVPDQDPEEIGKLIADYLPSLAPEGIQVTVDVHSGYGEAVRTNPTSTIAKMMSQAYSEVFDKPCQFIFEGASIPIVCELKKAADADVILMGLGLMEDQIHAPNENFGLDRFEKGFLIISRTIQLISGSS